MLITQIHSLYRILHYDKQFGGARKMESEQKAIKM